MAFNSNSPWLTVNSNKSRSPTSVRPPRKENSTYGIPIAHQYTVPVENRYTMLSSYQESQTANEVISPSDTMHPTRFTTTKNHKYNMEPRKNKNTSLNQHGSSVTHPSNKHNLQKRRESENKTNYIPTTVNGLTNVTPTSETKLEDNVPTRNLLNELRETINSYNKEVGTVSKKHSYINW